MSSVVADVARRLRGRRGGERLERPERPERVERREERREARQARRASRENFENESSSDWFWGSLLLVALLFVLSPGVLLTLPPGAGGVWMSGKTSVAAALVHAVLIAVIFNYI
jgi:hypothetical protein